MARRDTLNSPRSRRNSFSNTITTNSTRNSEYDQQFDPNALFFDSGDAATDVVGERASIADDDRLFVGRARQESIMTSTTIESENEVTTVGSQKTVYCEHSPPKIGVEKTEKKQDLNHPTPRKVGQYDFTWESPEDGQPPGSKRIIRDSPRNFFDGKSLLHYCDNGNDNSIRKNMLPPTMEDTNDGSSSSQRSTRTTISTVRGDTRRFSMSPGSIKRSTNCFSRDEVRPDPHMSLVAMLWPSTAADPTNSRRRWSL
mmetsp:Transcript_3986/g.6105  ORF Transcript_3986/g.6105 Transcript_3986/m.6105 type:complete len:256 (-) Transcript_3986:357-1124(-)